MGRRPAIRSPTSFAPPLAAAPVRRTRRQNRTPARCRWPRVRAAPRVDEPRAQRRIVVPVAQLEPAREQHRGASRSSPAATRAASSTLAASAYRLPRIRNAAIFARDAGRFVRSEGERAPKDVVRFASLRPACARHAPYAASSSGWPDWPRRSASSKSASASRYRRWRKRLRASCAFACSDSPRCVRPPATATSVRLPRARYLPPARKSRRREAAGDPGHASAPRGNATAAFAQIAAIAGALAERVVRFRIAGALHAPPARPLPLAPPSLAPGVARLGCWPGISCVSASVGRREARAGFVSLMALILASNAAPASAITPSQSPGRLAGTIERSDTRAIGARVEPTPVWRERQQHPVGPRERPCKVCDARVHADDEIERIDERRRAVEVVARVEHDERARPRALRRAVFVAAFLQRHERDIGAREQRGERCERARARAILHVVRATPPTPGRLRGVPARRQRALARRPRDAAYRSAGTERARQWAR